MDQASSENKISNLFGTAKIMGIIGGSLYIISLFMDAYTGIVPFVGTVTVKLSHFVEGLSAIIWIIGIASIVLSFFRTGIAQAVTGVLGIGFAIVVRVTLESKLDVPSVPTTLDIAPYMLFISAGLITVAGVLCEYAKHKDKRGNESSEQQKPAPINLSVVSDYIKAHKESIKKWGIRVLKIAVPVAGAVLLIILGVYLFKTVIPRSHYEKGLEAYNAQDYSTAVQEFTRAGRYPNASAKLEDAEIALHYQNGTNALNASDYELARTEFLAAGNYEDAESQAAYAELGVHYASGVSLLESGDYEAAINEFEAADYFPGSSNKINQSYYEMASDLYESGDYLSAAENYSLSNGYDDAEEMIIAMGDESMESGDYATAATYYEYSSDERYAAYALGMVEMSNGDYSPAIDHFLTADDLSDASERVTECRYDYGLELLVSRDYSASAAYLQLVSGYRDADTLLLVSSAESANQSRDIVTAVNTYSQVPEDFSVEGFDVQERRAIFTGPEAASFAEFCSPFEVVSLDAYCSNEGRYGSYGGWTLTEIVPDQELSFNCTYENGTFTVNGHVEFFIFEDYSPLREYTGYCNVTRNFVFEGLTTPPSSYEFEDGTTVTIRGDQATIHYHNVDNYSVGMNYVYDSVITFERVE